MQESRSPRDIQHHHTAAREVVRTPHFESNREFSRYAEPARGPQEAQH